MRTIYRADIVQSAPQKCFTVVDGRKTYYRNEEEIRWFEMDFTAKRRTVFMVEIERNILFACVCVYLIKGTAKSRCRLRPSDATSTDIFFSSNLTLMENEIILRLC